MSHNYKLISGGVTAPKGFLAAGVHCGIKKQKLDLAIIFSTAPAVGAGVFTTNKVKAAPLMLTMENLKQGAARAIIVNAGNANACTGDRGFSDAEEMVSLTAKFLGISHQEVIVSSTGVIGVPLPMDNVRQGIETAAAELKDDGGANAAKAIMTTDTFSKEITTSFQLAGKEITMGAMAKGSGMIHPNMATMLGFITTDANIEQEALQIAIKEATAQSFNMITVDGDTSTNDMVAIIANGEADNEKITLKSEYFGKFQQALNFLTVELAKLIAKDGEGATKLLEVQVKNARTIKDGRLAALAVAKSSLVKTAIFGEDANWGRILCAVGYSGAEFDPSKVDIAIGDEMMAIDGAGLAFDEERAKKILENKHVVIFIDLKDGDADATAWGC
ncbi:MAG: bifunctional ornithine acetyltransferase/N-acetylglutamate synthase, partial [Bacillota bacterium]|nr:bifunctional ornithine acetyltransferase/N-acetylglutamate synthase [Bacillota bacterium]